MSGHDWRAIVGYRLTDEQAYRLAAQRHRPGAPPLVPIHPAERDRVKWDVAVLDVDMVDPSLSHIACLTCEIQHAEAAGVPCPGEPVEHHPRTGEPTYRLTDARTGESRRVTWDRWKELNR